MKILERIFPNYEKVNFQTNCTSSGFIIIKIEDKKQYLSKFNINEKVEEIVKFKTNDQLNQFSNMYFNKLKKLYNIWFINLLS